MSLPVAAGSGLGRFARSSEDYVADIVQAKRRLGGRKLSAREKQAKLAHILSDKVGGIQRLGQSMIGPIQRCSASWARFMNTHSSVARRAVSRQPLRRGQNQP